MTTAIGRVCQCGNAMSTSGNRPDIRECAHCDRDCLTPGSCGNCARLQRADGIGPKAGRS